MIGLELPPQNWPLATWWAVGSAGVFLFGLIAGVVLQLVFVGRRISSFGDADGSVTRSGEKEPPTSGVRLVLQSLTFRQVLSTELGSVFFYVMVFGLITHIVFWIYAISLYNR
ncbi:hypothetical protein J0X15_03195 [Roseibium sp. CAU 1637]|uniref:Uncharacterized protein n=1 Tax=Roseibium limicola TaxID=2816037 RepID=A0A939EKR9_9HYPH|nr:hypothetical protein [Roseibium limicola]MBO0344217.1 hypothetical protein [Roseibium limicola]